MTSSPPWALPAIIAPSALVQRWVKWRCEHSRPFALSPLDEATRVPGSPLHEPAAGIQARLRQAYKDRDKEGVGYALQKGASPGQSSASGSFSWTQQALQDERYPDAALFWAHERARYPQDHAQGAHALAPAVTAAVELLAERYVVLNRESAQALTALVVDILPQLQPAACERLYGALLDVRSSQSAMLLSTVLVALGGPEKVCKDSPSPSLYPLTALFEKEQECVIHVLLNHAPERLRNQGCEDSGPPLLLALSKGMATLVDRLLRDGVDVLQTNHEGQTALMLAARYGHPHQFEKILSAGGARMTDVKGNTALHHLVMDVNAITDRNAVGERCALLLKAGASPEARNAEGKSVNDLLKSRCMKPLVEVRGGNVLSPPAVAEGVAEMAPSYLTSSRVAP